VKDHSARIYVAGHRGMLGSALVRRLQFHGYTNFITRSSQELDLRRQAGVEQFFMDERPDLVLLAAAKVGGIAANNTYRAEFIYENLAIESNVIHSAWLAGVKRLLFFSSSCVYPRATQQPMTEDRLWTGQLEPTNEPYAVAKLAGMSMCRAYNQQHGTHYFAVLPTNLYGENDNYHPENAHVVAALIHKIHKAKITNQSFVELWGTGNPRREFLYVNDAADAAIHLLENYTGEEPVNIGYGSDIEIKELAYLVRKVVGYPGEIRFDSSKPDGVPRKLLDSSVIRKLGWEPSTNLRTGLRAAYQDYLSHS
jgi:GDP-L-fucose synthase